MTNSEKNSMNKIAAEYAAKQMNRRAALSTAGKAAAGIAAIAVIGGAAYAMSNQGAAPAASPVTVTQTQNMEKTISETITSENFHDDFIKNSNYVGEVLTIYSGRGENLVGPLIQKFQDDTGVEVQIKYAKTSQLALTILEEKDRSPADLFYAQDAGALGLLSANNLNAKISDNLLNKIDSKFVSSKSDWIGVTGRARTIDYNINLVNESDLPQTIWDLLDSKWEGKVGWAPTNGSFQAFVTALRLVEGEDKALDWLVGMKNNDAQVYPKNTPIVDALGREEISLGLVNNYYLHRFLADDPDFPVAHHYTNDVGSMINIAGISILQSSKQHVISEYFINYLLSEQSQLYFTTNTFEYPLVQGVEVQGPQKPLSELNSPNIDLSKLEDLKNTIALLNQAELL